MNKDLELQNYLSISPNKFGIFLFDTKNFKNLYKDELIINNDSKFLNLDDLKKFLDKNIFKIEKLSGKFVENIFLIFENEKILNLKLGIKKKNYDITVTKQYLENLLIESKDLFRENYQNQEIMHMVIYKYFFNDKSYQSFQENLKSDYLALEIEFKFIPNSVIYDLNKILESYQIKINRYLDGNYVKNSFNNDIELSEMTYKILTGHNENEVTFMPKSIKKLSFFEKFFQLFS
tara:strand:+ start:1558 stop:2259 length:702 start_codon:yes stop_codon:yes gene_type:complete